MRIEIEHILRDLKALPVAPQILPKLQVLLGDLNSDTADLVDLIKLDSGLATKVLKLSNSAFYSRGREVTGIDEAIGLIGYQETFRVVAHSSYSSFMNRPLAVYRMKPGELWDQAVVCAFAMEALCGHIGEDVNDGYSIGLLHGIGMVAVNDFLEKGHDKSLPLPDLSPAGLSARGEIAMVGMDHCEIGAALLRRWSFPRSITEPIHYRFSPMLCADHQRMAYTLSLACELGDRVRFGPVEEGEGWEPNPDHLEIVSLDADQVLAVAGEVALRWEDARVFLG